MSSTKGQMLTFTRSVDASCAAVYRAFTSLTALREWLCDGSAGNVRVGGNLHLWWNGGYYVTGEYIALEQDKAVGFTWYGRGEPDVTQVNVALDPQDGQTLITLTHSQLGAGSAWVTVGEEFKKGWNFGLENLQSVLETGIDLRVARRPMLGITVAAVINAELAEKLGLPVSQGVQIDSALEGMGAAEAGLQKGDVIVSLGQTPIENFQSFAVAVSPYKAGDKVNVAFYRGGKKHTVKMTLSPRPMPEVPPRAPALAARVKEIYDPVLAEIAEIVKGISDEEAAHHPAEGEWSVKQVLSHLILSERDTQMYIASLASDNEVQNFPNNLNARVDALIAAHPTLAALMDELHRATTETLSLLTALPDEFVANKASYVRMGMGLLQSDLHPRGHYDQLREAIASARHK